jgi:nicotinamidase-related amidase
MAPTTALLVIDMQNFFESMTRAAFPNIQKLISQFQSPYSHIIYTQHGHSEEELATSPSPSQLVRKWGPDQCIAYGSADWELQPAIKERVTRSENAVVLPKNTYDAFVNTNLDDILREKGVDRVLVCGVMTDCCCDTTARSAFNRGFETWLVSDACATATKTQHVAALQGFGFGYGPVLTTVEALQALKKG